MAFSTTTELAQFAEKELGHNLSGSSSQRDDIVDHLDRAHKIVLAGGGILNWTETAKGPRRKRDEVDFLWAREQNPLIVNTVVPWESGFTASVTNNSTTITLNTDPTSGVDLSDYHIRIGEDGEVYRITSNSTVTLTIDAAYVGDTNATATAKIFKLIYSFGSSNILKYLGPIRLSSSSNSSSRDRINLVDRNEMLDQSPMSQIRRSFPSVAGILKYNAGTLTVQLNDYTENLERMVLDYIAIPSTLDTSTINPIIPAEYRLCIAYLAAYFMLQRNDDDRAKTVLGIARDIFDELVDFNKELLSSGDTNHGRIVPNLSQDHVRVIAVEKDYS